MWHLPGVKGRVLCTVYRCNSTKILTCRVLCVPGIYPSKSLFPCQQLHTAAAGSTDFLQRNIYDKHTPTKHSMSALNSPT